MESAAGLARGLAIGEAHDTAASERMAVQVVPFMVFGMCVEVGDSGY